MDSDENSLNNVNYLVKAASLLPSDNHFHKLLRSYYLTKCRRLAQTDDKNNKNLFNEEEMCRKCSTPWFDANYSLSIAPIQTTKRTARKIHKQIESKSKRKSHLAKKLSKKANNIMTIKCDLCDNKSKVILWKKSPMEHKQPNEMKTTNETNTKKAEMMSKAVVDEEIPVSAKKKRKKNKIKNAGLLFSVNKDDNSVKKIVNISRQMQTLDIQRNISQPPSKKKNKSQNQSKAKSKNNSKVMKNVQQPTVKRNNLLQLANALKAKGNQTGPNSQGDRLKKMLR